MLRAARRGRLELHVAVTHVKHVGNQLDKAVNRLVLGIVVAALIVGSAIVMTVSGGPSLLGLPLFGFLGFVSSIVGAVWLLLSIGKSGRAAERTGSEALPRVKSPLLSLLAVVAACAALLSGALPASTACAGEVAVICDRDIAPYRALLEAFTKDCDCTVRVIPPQEVSPEGLEQRLKASGVQAVVAVGQSARAAVEGLRDLPVLLTMVPQVAPWVAAQANRFGIEPSLSPRRHLETLRRVFPRAKRIGVIFDPAQTGRYVLEAQAAAAPNLSLVTREIARPGEFSRQLEEMRGQVDVIWLLPDATVLQGENINILLLASFESHLPVYGFARKYVDLGAIAASQFDLAALGAQLAELIRGLPAPRTGATAARWEYTRGDRLVLNQRVARKMGIVIDPAVLEGAADVIR